VTGTLTFESAFPYEARKTNARGVPGCTRVHIDKARYEGGVPVRVEKEKWRILPVGEVHDQPAALAGGHRRNAPRTNVSGSRQRRTRWSESHWVS
jgi:hypothetical protein